jgi:ABC-2 type transport system permease protein
MITTAAMTVATARMIARDRQTLVGILAFPVVFLLAFSVFDMEILGRSFTGEAGTGGLAYFDFVLPGILAMNVMQFAVLWTAGSVTRYREMGVLKRLAATPMRPLSFIVGQVIGRSMFAMMLGAVILTGGRLLGAEVHGIGLMLALVLVGNLLFVSAGFAVAGRATSVDSATTMASLVTMPMAFLSGAFFPVASMSAGMQSFVDWLPMTPLLRAMRSVALEGAGLVDIGPDVLQAAAWLPVLVALAAATFRLADR